MTELDYLAEISANLNVIKLLLIFALGVFVVVALYKFFKLFF